MCWDCYNNDKGDPHKMFTQGGVPIEDFDEEFRHIKVKAKKPRKKTRAGCPETEFKSHLYVWTSEYEDKLTLFYRYFGFHKYEREFCVGCGKKRGSRHSEKYEARKRREYDKRYGGSEFNVKRGEPVPKYRRNRIPSYRWWSWEMHHEGFMAYRREYINQRGYTEYSWWY